MKAAAEILYACPLCHREGFTKRGLQAHCCTAKPSRAGLSGIEYAQAVSAAHDQISPTKHTKMGTPSAFVVLSDTALRHDTTQLAKVQAATIEQFRSIPRLEREAAARAVLAGLALHRVKMSMPGEFSRWIAQMLPKVTSWTPATAKKNASFYMRLAATFVERAKVSKPDLLALPGDQTTLALDVGEGAARVFFDKLGKFVGDCSLNELLAKYGIKDAKALGGARTGSDGNGKTVEIDPEQLAANARAELSDLHETARQLLLTDNVCQYLSKEEQRAFDKSITGLLARWRSSLRATLAEK
jgi:hypothetical protein